MGKIGRARKKSFEREGKRREKVAAPGRLEKGVGIYTQALLAGNDLLLCNDYTAAYEEILQAVQDGIISEDLLNRAVFRILCWKCTLGLM